MLGHISSSAPEADPAAENQTNQATQSLPVPAVDASRVHSPTFSQPHLIHEEEKDDELEESKSLVGQTSRAPVHGSVVHSPTFNQHHQVGVEDSDEKSVESPIVHSPTFSQPHQVAVEDDDDEESIGESAVPNPRATESNQRLRSGGARPALRMNATPRDAL